MSNITEIPMSNEEFFSFEWKDYEISTSWRQVGQNWDIEINKYDDDGNKVLHTGITPLTLGLKIPIEDGYLQTITTDLEDKSEPTEQSWGTTHLLIYVDNS